MSLLVAYDMDGTLIPSDYYLSDELSKMLIQRGYPISAREIFTHGGSGSSLSKFKKLAALKGWQFDEPVLDELCAEHKRLKLGVYDIPHCRVAFSGVITAVREIGARGHTQVLCSNGEIEPIDEIMRENSLTAHFNGGVFTAPYLRMEMKPDPSMLRHALRRAKHADGDRAVFVGDGEADMQAAEKAGFAHRVGFINPDYALNMTAEMKKLRNAGATIFLTHYRDLPGIIAAIERS
jgi:phosphoglycolate phosphatase-like HAD superfamily hydrolase